LNAFCDELSAELRIPIPSDRIYLSWKEIQEMSARGIAFGSHSHTHPILTRIPLDRVPSELQESRRILVSHRLNFAPVFCYPNGNSSPQVKALVQQADYRAAVTTQDGTEKLAPVDRFAIRRVCIHEDVTRTAPQLTVRLVTACAANRSHSAAP
jgi:peptidoglycan/xylan/chitin deacetylase (PgdA/CDA1 family)